MKVLCIFLMINVFRFIKSFTVYSWHIQLPFTIWISQFCNKIYELTNGNNNNKTHRNAQEINCTKSEKFIQHQHIPITFRMAIMDAIRICQLNCIVKQAMPFENVCCQWNTYRVLTLCTLLSQPSLVNRVCLFVRTFFFLHLVVFIYKHRWYYD